MVGSRLYAILDVRHGPVLIINPLPLRPFLTPCKPKRPRIAHSLQLWSSSRVGPSGLGQGGGGGVHSREGGNQSSLCLMIPALL